MFQVSTSLHFSFFQFFKLNLFLIFSRNQIFLMSKKQTTIHRQRRFCRHTTLPWLNVVVVVAVADVIDTIVVAIVVAIIVAVVVAAVIATAVVAIIAVIFAIIVPSPPCLGTFQRISSSDSYSSTKVGYLLRNICCAEPGTDVPGTS